jgi:hypothetical protein
MQCRMCHNPLNGPPKTRGKMFCDIICQRGFYRKRRKEGTKKGEPQFSTKCQNCGCQFLTLRSTRKWCSAKCRVYFVGRETHSEWEPQIEDWLKELAKRKWWANMSDIFQLIHYHSLIFPKKSYDNNEYGVSWEREEVFNFMLKDLVVWIKKKKKMS